MNTIIFSIICVFSFFFLGGLVSIIISFMGAIIFSVLRKLLGIFWAQWASFIVFLALYCSWAIACWIAADATVAIYGINRWVALFFAAAIAGAPYHWAQKSVRNTPTDMITEDSKKFGEPMGFAGGLQSKLVVVMMIAGWHFDWWKNLPG